MSRIWEDSADRIWEGSSDRVWEDNLILQLSQPVFVPIGGAYSIDATIKISAVLGDVFYSIDGSYPTIPYTGPIQNFDGTLKAITIKTGYLDSEISSDSYSISAPADWAEDRNRGPWPFIEQPDKWGFLNNPRWTKNASPDNLHIPCGHWHKRPRPIPEGEEIVESSIIPSGEWVAAMSQDGTPYVYVYDIDYYNIIKIDLTEDSPKVVGLLSVNNSKYDLDYNKGYGLPGSQRGGYCISKNADRIWYLFRGTGAYADKQKLVEVDISGDTMVVVDTTIFDGLISDPTTISDACSDGNDIYFSTSLVSLQIIRFAPDHTMTDNHLYGFSAYAKEAIAGMDMTSSFVYFSYVKQWPPDIRVSEAHYAKADRDLTIVIDEDWTGIGTNSPHHQNFLRIYDGYVWTHRAYYPSSGTFERRSLTDFGGTVNNYQEYMQNILGTDGIYIYTFWHQNAITPQAFLRKTKISDLTKTDTDITYYWSGGEWVWTATSTFNKETSKSILFRWLDSTDTNWGATFDTTVALISDIALGTLYETVGDDSLKSYPDQNTDNEPQIWAMPGETYDEKNNI